MKTLIIYDNEGIVFNQISGDFKKPSGGIQYLEFELQEGKQVVSVDVSVTPHQVILEDIPPSEIDVLKKRTEDLEILLTDILMGGF